MAKVVWQSHQAVLRCRDILAQSAIGIVLEHPRALRGEAEVPVERVRSTGYVVPAGLFTEGRPLCHEW